jgi:hypothetical protein
VTSNTLLIYSQCCKTNKKSGRLKAGRRVVSGA